MNKIITIGTMKIEITDERKKRIYAAKAETEQKLNKELNYSEDLQHKDVIEFYRSHIAKLEDMLK